MEKEINRLWIFNKPVGYVSSNKEQKNQKSLFRLFPNNIPRVVTVGRLDIMSEGLMIITNNPSIASFLETPKNNIKRKYLVSVNGKLHKVLLIKQKNLLIDGQLYRKIKLGLFFQKSISFTRN